MGQAGDGGDQDRAEHKAHDADRGKDKTLPSGQAFAFGIIEERGEFLVDLDYWQQPGEAGAEAVFSQSAIPSDNTRDAVLQAFHILNAFDIPLGAVRASEDGGIIAEYATWTSAADLKDLTWYFRTYHDQSIRSVELPGGTGGCQWPDANDSDGFPSARSGRVEVIQLDPVTRTWALMCPLHRGGQGKAVARWAILFDPTGIGP